MTLRHDPETGVWEFMTETGPRTLGDPEGPPTGRQLLRLAYLGLLEIRDKPDRPLTKLDAARAIDRQESGA